MHPYGHGGDILTAAELAGLAPVGILDFSANINPLGPPPGLFEYLAQKMPAIVHYPDPACRNLCRSIREHYQPSSGFLPGNGAGELIYLMMRAVAPARVLIPVPTFTLYEKAAVASGCEVARYRTEPASRFAIDTDGFCAEIRRLRPGLVILCNPNNPTGNLLAKDAIYAVARETAEAGGLLMVDEAFLEFSSEYEQHTLLSSAPDNIFVLRSLTKMFAIPGLRLGFLAGSAPVLAVLQNLRDPWSVNTLAQLAGEFVLSDTEFVRKTAEKTQELGEKLAAELRGLSGLRVFDSAANYLLLKSEGKPGGLLQRKLLEKGILVRGCESWPGLDSSFIRVAVRKEEENKTLLAALQAVTD